MFVGRTEATNNIDTSAPAAVRAVPFHMHAAHMSGPTTGKCETEDAGALCPPNIGKSSEWLSIATELIHKQTRAITIPHQRSLRR
jgi:hypothetical protein